MDGGGFIPCIKTATTPSGSGKNADDPRAEGFIKLVKPLHSFMAASIIWVFPTDAAFTKLQETPNTKKTNNRDFNFKLLVQLLKQAYC